MRQDTFYRQLGTTLAQRRREKGLSQSQVASRIDVPRARLANIETGRQSVSVHQLVELASVLGVKSVEALLPANFILPVNAERASPVETTGSHLNAEQKKKIASIFDSLSD